MKSNFTRRDFFKLGGAAAAAGALLLIPRTKLFAAQGPFSFLV